jgi:transposase
VKLDIPEDLQVEITEDEWRRTPASVKRAFALQELRIQQLEQLIELLQKKIEELEEKLNANSGNSSKPPSSDPPWARKRKRKKGKGRKRGGQPGHEGKTRELVPEDQIDKTIKCIPETCEHCNDPDIEVSGEYLRHQILDIPEIKPHVTEYRLYSYWCSGCGRWHTAMLPLEAGQGMLGSAAAPRWPKSFSGSSSRGS